MNSITLVICTTFLFSTCSVKSDLEDDLQEDHSDWVDFGDMLNYDPGKRSMRNNMQKIVEVDKETGEEEVIVPKKDVLFGSSHKSMQNGIKECPAPDEELRKAQFELRTCQRDKRSQMDVLTYYQRFTARFLNFYDDAKSSFNLFSSTATMSPNYYVEIELGEEDIQTLREFASGSGSIDVLLPKVDAILSGMLLEINQDRGTRKKWWQEIVTFEFTCAIISIGGALLTLAFMMYKQRSATGVIFIFIFTVFIISVAWHWKHLYQVEVAKRHANFGRSPQMPPECTPQSQLTWQQSLSMWFNQAISSNEDPCERYHKMVLVDPLWEISPMMAISETIAVLITHPMERLGAGVGKLINGMNSHLSFWQKLFLMPMIVIFTCLFILICCQYSFSMPFLRIGPSRERPSVTTLRTEELQLTDSEKAAIRAGRSHSAGNFNINVNIAPPIEGSPRRRVTHPAMIASDRRRYENSTSDYLAMGDSKKLMSIDGIREESQHVFTSPKPKNRRIDPEVIGDCEMKSTSDCEEEGPRKFKISFDEGVARVVSVQESEEGNVFCDDCEMDVSGISDGLVSGMNNVVLKDDSLNEA